MNKKIRGITVQIGGDTTGLTKALGTIEAALKSTRGELREIEKGLKFDPGNTTLVAQKQEVLSKAIEDTANKLKMLKDAQGDVQKAFDEKKLEADQYREFQREIEKTDSQLTNLRRELSDMQTPAESSADSLKEVGTAAKNVGDESGTAADKVGEFKDELKSDISGAVKTVAALSAAILAVGKSSVDAGMEFDSSMQKVMATLGYSKDEINAVGSDGERTFEALRDYAQQMGASTKFSASESAEALNYMAMAGWDDQQMLAGLGGVLDLAAASGSELAATSDIVTDALTALGYGAEEAGHLADVMAAASSNANTNVEMMGETFQYAAPVAGALGYSMEDTAIAIGLMANSGIKASSAGTALRGWMSQLAAPTKETKTAMDELGLTLTDSEGNMKSLRDVMSDTRTAFDGLTESEQAQYAKLLAGQQGMSGLLAIVNAAPADFSKLTEAIDNSTGAASKMAETNIDNLSGDITIMKSAIEGAEIAISDKLTPSLRKYTQIGTKVISAMAEGFGRNGLEGAIESAHLTLSKEMGEDANKIFAVEAAVKALTAAFIAYKGAMVLSKGIAALEQVNKLLAEGKTLTQAMNAASLSNPWVLLASAVVGVGVQIKSYIDSATDAIDVTEGAVAVFTDEQQKMMDSVNDTAQAISDSRSKYEDNAAAIDANKQQVETLVDRLYALDEVQDKDKSQKAEMAAIVDELNGSVAGLNLKYDEQTGKLNKTKDAVDDLVDSYFEEAKAQAYKERLVELIGEQIKAEEAHEKAVAEVEKAEGRQSAAQNRVNSLTAAYNRNVKKLNQLEKERSGSSWTDEKEAEYNRLIAANDKLLKSGQDLDAEMDNIETGMGDLQTAQITAKDTLDNVTESIDNMRAKMGETSEQMPEESAAVAQSIDGIGQAMDGVKTKADDAYNSLTESFYIQDELQPALEEVYALVDGYNNELESRKGTLQNWFEGSVKVSDEDLTMNDLWTALNGTTANLDEWQASIDRLTEEGINDKYLQQLKDAGPSSLNEIRQLFSVPEDERKRYADEWADGYDRAAEVAEKQMSAAKDLTEGKVGEIIGVISANSPQMQETFNQLGIDGIDGYINAFSDPDKLQQLKDAVRMMTETAMAEVQETQDSNSPSKKFKKLGGDAGDGYALGFEDSETTIQKAAREMTESALKAVNNVSISGSAKGFADELRNSAAAFSAVRDSAFSAADSPRGFSAKQQQTQFSVKFPETITANTYLDGKLIAQNQAPYLDVINANRVTAERRGHAT